MLEFERAVEITLGREGVLSDDKNDKGGLTKYGISKKAYPDLDIAGLTKDQAVAIYRRDYWDVNRCGDLPWWAALMVFDTGVNHGPGRAARWLQQTLGVVVDGKIGDKTVAAAKVFDVTTGIEEFMTLRMLSYTEDSSWPTFRKGWTRRAFGIALEAYKPFR